MKWSLTPKYRASIRGAKEGLCFINKRHNYLEGEVKMANKITFLLKLMLKFFEGQCNSFLLLSNRFQMALLSLLSKSFGPHP